VEVQRENPEAQKERFRAGYVAIIGRPNVGKSTLLNAFLGMKLSIVTEKPQTTRHKILGILTGESYQILFLDTPGMIEPRYHLQEVMVQAIRRALQDADVLLMMIEAREYPLPDDLGLLEELKGYEKPIILVINKIDLIKKDLLLPLIDAYQKAYPFQDIVPISALKRDGVDLLLGIIIKNLPENPPYYPEDYLTDQPERFFVGEIIREKIFMKYGEEIPYSTAVVVEEFREQPGEKDFIRATIVVEKESQKAIIIGKQGQKLKQVGSLAREEIERFLGRPVYLELWVKVREKWRKSPRDVRTFGYGTRP